MAAIDKIYITGWDNYSKFRDWIDVQPPLKDKYGKEIKLSAYLYKYKKEEWGNETTTRPVMNNDYYVDAYIIRNCPFDFIQEELMLNYGHWSQKRLYNAYETVKNRKPEVQKVIDNANGEYPKGSGFNSEELYYWYWNIDDFNIDENGIISVRNKEKSDYELIKEGNLCDKPYFDDIKYGSHFRMIDCPRKHGYNNFERPLKGCWLIDIDVPEDMPYMWHHNYGKWNATGTWDFSGEFVICDGASSSTIAKTITSLKRKINKWKLPVGAKVVAIGRYICEKYVFLITK